MKIGQWKMAKAWELSPTLKHERGSWKAFVDFEKQMDKVQEPRTMDLADGGRIGFEYGGIVKALEQLIAQENTNFKSMSDLKNKIKDITGKKPGGSFQMNHKDYGKLLKQFTFENFKTKKKTSPAVLADDTEGLKQLRQKIEALNKKYNLANKGMKFDIIKLTQTGNYQPQLTYTAETHRQSIPLKSGTKSKYKDVGSIEYLENILKEYMETDNFKNYDKHEQAVRTGEKTGTTQVLKQTNKIPVLEYMQKNPGATIEQMSKNLDLPKGEIESTLKSMYGDVYWRKADEGAAWLKKYVVSDNYLDDLRTSIKNTGVNLEDEVRHLVIDAYQERGEDFKPVVEKLKKWGQLHNRIKNSPYGKFFTPNLDHVIPLNFIRLSEQGADLSDLIRVKPLPEYLNQGAWKKNLDQMLQTAWRGKNGVPDKEGLKLITEMFGYLPEELGGLSPEGKILDYKAKPFNIDTEIVGKLQDFDKVYERVFTFLEDPKVLEIQKKLADKGYKFTPRQLIDSKAEIKSQYDGFKKLLEEIGCPKGTYGKASGGRVGFKSGLTCAAKGRERVGNILTNGTGTAKEKDLLKRLIGGGANLLRNTPKALGNLVNPKEFLKLRNWVGPEAIALMGAVEGGIIGYDVINNNTPIKEALGKNWATSWAMPKTLDEYQIEEMRKNGYLDNESAKRYAADIEKVEELNRDYQALEFAKKGPYMTGVDNSEEVARRQKDYNAKLEDYYAFVEEGGGMDPIEFEKSRTRMLEERGAGTFVPGEVKEDMFGFYVEGDPEANEPGKIRVNEYGYKDVGDETMLKKILPDSWVEQGTSLTKDPKFTDKRLPPQLGGDYSLNKMPDVEFDLTKYEPLPGDYREAEYEKLTEQDIIDLTNYYRATGRLGPDETLEEMIYTDTGKSMLEEAELAKKWSQLFYAPGMQGTQDPNMAEGGIASLKRK